jgi:hypothetical protein
MSVATEITRLQNAKANLKASINAKTDSQHQIDDETIDEYADFVDSIQTGGGGGEVEKDVYFYDYDGTLVDSYTASEFLELTEMPAQPTHTGLVAEGWNWNLTDAKEYVTTYGGVIIGGMYNTSTGGTRIYITIDNDTLSPLLSLGFEGDITVDWGDGTTDTFTGIASDINSYIKHTYQSAGDYVIEIINGNIPITIFGYGTSTMQFSRLICGNKSNFTNGNQQFLNTIKKIELGNNVLLGISAFASMFDLKIISMPPYISITQNYTFSRNYNLKVLIIPNDGSVTILNGGALYSLEVISFPKQITATGTIAIGNSKLDKITLPLGNYTISSASNQKLRKVIIPNTVKLGATSFSECISLTAIKIPTNGSTSLFNQVFYNTGLEEITIPSNITSIGERAFMNCNNIKEITIPSTVSSIGSSSFSSMASLKKIKNYSNKLSTYAFQNNHVLEEIEMSFEGITTIPASCFENDYSLKALPLENSTTLTGLVGFKNCYSLQLSGLPSSVTTIYNNAFENCYSLNLSSLPSITVINQFSFAYCDNRDLKTLPDSVTKLNSSGFAGNQFTQLSMNSVTTMTGSSTSNGPFIYMPNIVAFWIGSAITNAGFLRHSLSSNNTNNYKRIYIDLPRATVEGFTNYNYAFCNNANKKSIIICNDDADWITKAEFDAIDWETYTP